MVASQVVFFQQAYPLLYVGLCKIYESSFVIQCTQICV